MSTDATEHMTTTPPLSIGTQRNILVVGPHPDDQELGMGGTIAMLAAEGHRVVILDMTSGEPTPYGDPATRAKEAAAAAAALAPTAAHSHRGGSVTRIMLGDGILPPVNGLPAGLPNRSVQHTLEARHLVAGVIRKYQIGMIFVPHPTDAHPDHLAVTRIVVDARFDAKLTKVSMPGDGGMPPLYPKWLIYYFATHLRIVPQPGFMMDTSAFTGQKRAAIDAYRSQFEMNPSNRGLPDRLAAMDAYMGSRIGTAAAEAFYSDEPIGLTGLGNLA